jgi:ABC-type thiamine transport system substrate-binding protein
METDILFGLRQIKEYWYATVEGIAVGPGAKHKEVANVFYKWLKDGGFQDCCDAKETILDKEFKLRNEGR